MAESIRFHFDNIHFDAPLALGPYRVMQFGDLSAARHTCAPHIQRVHELSCIVSGAATFTCGDQTYAVRRGDLVFSPRTTVHAIDADGDLRFYYIGFAVVDRTDPTDRQLGTFFDAAAPFAAPYDTELTDAFSGLFQNYLNPDEFSAARMTDAVRQLLIASVRAHRQTPMRVYHPTAVPEKSRLLAELCAYLDGHPAQIDALAQLPARFGYSAPYLSALFSDAMGVSLRTYFLTQRHAYACRLLADGHSVTETAQILQYNSIHAFSRAFRARAGVSPSGYIQNSKKERSLS